MADSTIRSTVLVALSLLLASCGDDTAPFADIPAWAKVAPEQIAEAKKHGVPVAFEVTWELSACRLGGPGHTLDRRFRGDA